MAVPARIPYHPRAFFAPRPVIRSLLTLLLLPAAVLAAPTRDPAAPAVPARTWILLDYESGEVLASHKPDARVEPASLTKLMTAYVVFDALRKGELKPDEDVTVSKQAWRRGYFTRESRMFIEVGSRVSVTDLLRGVIVQSGNDASVALAERVSGDEKGFVERMNRQAQALGMKGTRFGNSTGVPDARGLYTTARDMATLSAALIRDFPDQYALFAETEFTHNGIRQYNRNILLRREGGVDGLKTGHHDSAGYCLAASAVRDGRRLISVVMGAKNVPQRTAATQSLFNYGYRRYEVVTAAAPGRELARARLWKGAEPEALLGVGEPLTISVARALRDKVSLSTEVNGPLVAPLLQGQVVGEVQVRVDGKTVRRAPLQVLADRPQGDLWRRVSDTVRLKLREFQ